jgi:hypothetical protein
MILGYNKDFAIFVFFLFYRAILLFIGVSHFLSYSYSYINECHKVTRLGFGDFWAR